MSKIQNRSTKGDKPIRQLPKACADEVAAVEFLEQQRWGKHPACPQCGGMDVYTMQDRKNGEREKHYRWRCRDCGKLYSVRTGTVFEDSRIPLRHWCFAFWRAATSKKGVSALEIKRQTGLSYKSSLFLMHRIRFAMGPELEGKLSGTVEVDEMFVGGKPRYSRNPRKRQRTKQPVVAMVERGGLTKTRVVADVTAKTLQAAIREIVDLRSRLMTDEWSSYRLIGREFASHETVRHSTFEYARGEAHINTAESFFALVKRSLNGIYHAVSKKHLPRYLTHAEFLWNHRHLDDGERVVRVIKASEGKRLYYATPVREKT